VSPADRSALSRRVTEAVGEALRVRPDVVLATSSLFDLPGFDSLAVVAVLERLESDLSVEVPPEQIVPEAFASVEALTSLFEYAVGAASAVLPIAGGRQ
jgi:acyl carrier protein